jgi:hypothetical protein
MATKSVKLFFSQEGMRQDKHGNKERSFCIPLITREGSFLGQDKQRRKCSCLQIYLEGKI